MTLSNALAVKIWSLGSSTPNFQLEAHETKGVNHVDYYPHSDKPYLLTTSDDVRECPDEYPGFHADIVFLAHC